MPFRHQTRNRPGTSALYLQQQAAKEKEDEGDDERLDRRDRHKHSFELKIPTVRYRIQHRFQRILRLLLCPSLRNKVEALRCVQFQSNLLRITLIAGASEEESVSVPKSMEEDDNAQSGKTTNETKANEPVGTVDGILSPEQLAEIIKVDEEDSIDPLISFFTPISDPSNNNMNETETMLEPTTAINSIDDGDDLLVALGQVDDELKPSEFDKMSIDHDEESDHNLKSGSMDTGGDAIDSLKTKEIAKGTGDGLKPVDDTLQSGDIVFDNRSTTESTSNSVKISNSTSTTSNISTTTTSNFEYDFLSQMGSQRTQRNHSNISNSV